MWHKLGVFGTLLALVIALERVSLEQSVESFIVPTSCARLFTAFSLAAGATWFWFRLRSIRSKR